MYTKTHRPSGIRNILLLALGSFLILGKAAPTAFGEDWPGKTWDTESPEQAGLSIDALKAAAKYAGGSGCVVRHGRMVFSWGNPAKRGDVASAAKPVYTYFLFKALETGRLPSLDTLAAVYEPRLNTLNANLGYKDRKITLRELANQTSCYGVSEQPGTAFDYSDWQMALFTDILFTKIYGTTYEAIDQQVFRPLLSDPLQCEDNPTLKEFPVTFKAGRLAISPRDYARFGLLYLREGRWRDGRLLSAKDVHTAVASPLPANLPRTTAKLAEMIPGQTSNGSHDLPDDETDHFGSYSFDWWINGVDRNGKRRWPNVPIDAYSCLGHENGLHGLAVIPSLDLVVSWNDTVFGTLPAEPHPPGVFLGIIAQGVQK